MMGFEPLVNQRLLPPTFPRYTKIKSRKEALHYLESLVGRLRIACKIGGINTFHGALVRQLSLSLSHTHCHFKVK